MSFRRKQKTFENKPSEDNKININTPKIYGPSAEILIDQKKLTRMDSFKNAFRSRKSVKENVPRERSKTTPVPVGNGNSDSESPMYGTEDSSIIKVGSPSSETGYDQLIATFTTQTALLKSLQEQLNEKNVILAENEKSLSAANTEIINMRQILERERLANGNEKEKKEKETNEKIKYLSNLLDDANKKLQQSFNDSLEKDKIVSDLQFHLLAQKGLQRDQSNSKQNLADKLQLEKKSLHKSITLLNDTNSDQIAKIKNLEKQIIEQKDIIANLDLYKKEQQKIVADLNIVLEESAFKNPF